MANHAKPLGKGDEAANPRPETRSCVGGRGTMLIIACTAWGSLIQPCSCLQQGGKGLYGVRSGSQIVEGPGLSGGPSSRLAFQPSSAGFMRERPGFAGAWSGTVPCLGNGFSQHRRCSQQGEAAAGIRMQEMSNSEMRRVSRGRINADLMEAELLRRSTWIDNNLDKLDTNLRSDDGFLTSEVVDKNNFLTDLISTFQSRITIRILFRLGITTAWAAYVTATVMIGDFVSPDVVGKYTNFEVPNWPHELVGGFLAILIVFRTNQAYERFWMGRQLWADLQGHIRKITMLTIAHLPPGKTPEVLAHMAAFPTALRMHLRGYRSERELSTIYSIFLGPNNDEVKRVIASNNMPLTVIMSVSRLLAPLRGFDRSSHYEAVWAIAEEGLDGLTDVVSGCEQIKCTPLPLSYSRHTSRFFSLFTFSLPFALVKQTSPLIVPIVVLLVSWVLFATNEVGHVIEDPFGNLETGDLVERKGAGNPSSSRATQQEICDMFLSLDQDKKGYVTVADAQRGVPLILEKKNLSQDVVGALLGGLDMDGDGVIDAEEFVYAWTLFIGSVPAKRLEVLPLSAYCDTVLREMIYYWGISRKTQYGSTGLGKDVIENAMIQGASQKAFFGMDKDGSGSLNQEELRQAMPPWATDDDVRREFGRLDADKDGEVDMDEMRNIWGKSYASAWLKAKGFGQYCGMFDSLGMDVDTLCRLTADDLAAMGIESLGKRKAIMEQIVILNKEMDSGK